jgi:hypothetical protein
MTDAPEAPKETTPVVFTYGDVTYLPVAAPHGNPCNGCAGNSKTGDPHVCLKAPGCVGAIYVKDTRGNRVKHTIWRLSK